MLSPESATSITILIYFAASSAGIYGLIRRKFAIRKLGCWLTLAAFSAQTLELILGFHSLLPAGLSPGAYIQLLAWFFLLAGTGAWIKYSQDSILLLSAPLGLCIYLLSVPWLRQPLELPAFLSASFYTLHIGALFLALGLLTLAFLAALLFLALQRRIKAKKKLTGLWGEVPALSILEKIISFCSVACYPLYTIGLAAGLIWGGAVFGRHFTGDPKEFISLFIWLLFTWLFYKKVVSSWTGKKPAILVIFIFCLSCLSIIAVNFIVPSHHGFV